MCPVAHLKLFMNIKTKIYAHRGYSEVYPENTMIAFEEAIQNMADGIETDVQMTKDGELVLIHDEKIDRTSNGSGYVCEYTYEQLSEFDFGRWKNEEFKNTRIPRLEELLILVKRSGVEINIELKNNIIKYPKLEDKVADKVRQYNLQNDVIISSFNHQSLLGLIDQGFNCGALTYSEIISPERYIKENRFYSYHPMYKTLNEESIRKLHEENIPIYTYTVNNDSDMRFLKNNNVDVIITNEVVKGKNI